MSEKNNQKELIIEFSEGLSVSVMPDSTHEFLMPTKDVAKGYGVNPSALRTHMHRYKDELLENKHFVRGVAICNGAVNSTRTTMWTKQGVIRLGFFIRGERAKLFRDWVESLVLNYIEKKLPQLPETTKRKHNRLTNDRLLDIMKDVCRIEDTDLRLSIVNKLMGKV